MSKLRFLLILLCTLFLFVGCIKVKREYYGRGKLKSETHYRLGKETGTTTYYHENYPTKIMEVEMKKGKRNGKLIKRHFDGNLELLAFYKNDLLEGKEIYYHKNGQPAMEINYTKGIKNGKVTSWYSNGELMESGAYVNGLSDGVWENYDERGLLIGEALFDKGTGKRVIYDALGRIQMETHFVNNQKEGLETYYLTNGEIEKTILFKEDRIVAINGVSIENL